MSYYKNAQNKDISLALKVPVQKKKKKKKKKKNAKTNIKN